ncbi:hypothetical protein HOG27_00315 [bacterium]|nr:hypothetical protein [bacterium]MBT6778933.1 hypothetical protein [bacterium]
MDSLICLSVAFAVARLLHSSHMSRLQDFLLHTVVNCSISFFELPIVWLIHFDLIQCH